MIADRRTEPLFRPEESDAPEKATALIVEPCSPAYAVALNAAWHSRLPHAQQGPWKLAFRAVYEGTCFGVALWHNPSARGLPQDWLELRRLAVASDAPHCTASRMLGEMRRWIARNLPDVPRLISYQDAEVHTGTIYRAAGWEVGAIVKARQRDRSKARRGTRRDYRSSANGKAPDGSEKIRWEVAI